MASSILSDSTNSQQEQDATEIIRQAYTLLISNRIQQAIAMYKRCIAQHPKCWRAYQNLGVAYINAKDFQNAYQVLMTYVQHVPKDPLGHDNLGVSYSQLNDPLQAIASFVNAINLAPGYYMPYYNLGVVLGKLSLHQLALNVYKRCLQLQPNYINAMNNIGDIYKKFDDIDAAIQIFQQLLEINPNYTLGIQNLGNCYFAKKQYFQAFNTYIRFIQINPNSDLILCNISFCLDHFGLYGLAAQCLTKASKQFEKTDHQLLTRLFIAGNLYCKQLHSINKIRRITKLLRIQSDRKLKQQFYDFYYEAIRCFSQLSRLVQNCQEAKQNITRTHRNLVSYEAKLGEAFSLLQKQFQNIQTMDQVKRVRSQLLKQMKIMKQIYHWRKYLKRLIKTNSKAVTQSQKKYYFQQKQLCIRFNKKWCQPNQYKIKSYISRSNSHRLKRLILKRYKFIKKYKKFNSQFQKAFKHRPMLTELAVHSKQLIRSDSRVDLERENVNQMELEGNINSQSPNHGPQQNHQN